MKKLEIKKTKPTFIMSISKVVYTRWSQFHPFPTFLVIKFLMQIHKWMRKKIPTCSNSALMAAKAAQNFKQVVKMNSTKLFSSDQYVTIRSKLSRFFDGKRRLSHQKKIAVGQLSARIISVKAWLSICLRLSPLSTVMFPLLFLCNYQ